MGAGQGSVPELECPAVDCFQPVVVWPRVLRHDMQAEPQELRWALAAAGAAGQAAADCSAGDAAAAAAGSEAVARYEAVLERDGACTEALQQLAALCAAAGIRHIVSTFLLEQHVWELGRAIQKLREPAGRYLRPQSRQKFALSQARQRLLTLGAAT